MQPYPFVRESGSVFLMGANDGNLNQFFSWVQTIAEETEKMEARRSVPGISEVRTTKNLLRKPEHAAFII